MNIEEAKEIVETWFGSSGPGSHKINAIKLLRSHTAMGLHEAKKYMDENSLGRGMVTGKEALLSKLCADFVQSKQDLLDAAREDRRKLDQYIQELEAQLYFEEYGTPIELADVPGTVYDPEARKGWTA